MQETELREQILQLVNTKAGAAGPNGGQTLPDMYRELAQNAVKPGGHIFVLGYPNLVEESSKWSLWWFEGNRCSRISRADTAMLRSTTGYFNQQLAAMVERLDAETDRNFHWIDVSQIYENDSGRHGLCTGEPWINGITAGVRGPKSGRLPFRHQGSFHPNQKGHDATGEFLAKEMEAVLAQERADAPTGNGENCPSGETGCLVDRPIFDGSSTSTVMVVDVSTSMADPSPVGEPIPKITAAVQAVRDLVSVVEIDADEGVEHSVGIVGFSTDSQVLAAATGDLGRVSAAAGRLSANGDTDIGAGLERGIQAVLDDTDLKRIVLLSDGDITDGLSQDQVLAQIVPQAVARDVRIDVVGFAEPGSLDESFLESIAGLTGGSISFASTAQELSRDFVRARHEATGAVVVDIVGEFDADSDGAITEFDVPPASSRLIVTLGYDDGTDINPILVDSFGRPMPSELLRIVGTNPVTVAVEDPLPGRWSIHVNEPDDPVAADRLLWQPPVDGSAAGSRSARRRWRWQCSVHPGGVDSRRTGLGGRGRALTTLVTPVAGFRCARRSDWSRGRRPRRPWIGGRARHRCGSRPSKGAHQAALVVDRPYLRSEPWRVLACRSGDRCVRWVEICDCRARWWRSFWG